MAFHKLYMIGTPLGLKNLTPAEDPLLLKRLLSPVNAAEDTESHKNKDDEWSYLLSICNTSAFYSEYR